MRKRTLIFICIAVWYICFCIMSELLKSMINNNALISFVIFFVPTFVAVVLYYSVIHFIVTLDEKVKESSIKYKEITEINQKYNFSKINRKITLEENEFSIKSFNDILAKQVVLYRIENNEDNIREWIEKAIINENIFKSYEQEVKAVYERKNNESINKAGLSEEKFNEIEKDLLDSIIVSDDIYNIQAHVIVHYCDKDFNILNKKSRYVFFDELKLIYNEWNSGKKYNVTTKKERKLMNYSLREAVLKRDNYKCCACGKTEKDGVRLEIDHIIPVSKGGQSTISNLQTLCSSCNLKKNTQDNETFIKKSIKERLIKFRKNRSKELDIPAYYIFSNDELEKLIEVMPKNINELRNSGILPNIKLVKHGELIVKVINENK